MLLNGCLVVTEEFDCHIVQGWTLRSLIFDDGGHVWFCNVSSDNVLQLDHYGKSQDSFRALPPMVIGDITTVGGLLTL